MATSENAPNNVLPWFIVDPSADELNETSKTLLEQYSGIPRDEVLNHVVALRDEAWKIFPYPCIGQLNFLEAGISDLNEYSEVIERLRRGQTLLDMACCFGQTIRRLAYDGAPSDNMYGSDLQPEFFELGYKLFNDRNKLRAKFLSADIFDPASALSSLSGKVDIVYAGSFFHLWGLEKQKQVSKIVVRLLRPEPGSLILGRQMGAENAEEGDSPTGTMFRHNVESFKQLWKEIGDELGVSFQVDASLRKINRASFREQTTARFLYFSVRRE